jgi:hypothetical protein
MGGLSEQWEPGGKSESAGPQGWHDFEAFVVMHHEWDEHASEGVQEHMQDELIRVPYDGTADFVITLKPGVYDIYASSFGYDPKCMKVNVQFGQHRALVFQLNENKLIYEPKVE